MAATESRKDPGLVYRIVAMVLAPASVGVFAYFSWHEPDLAPDTDVVVYVLGPFILMSLAMWGGVIAVALYIVGLSISAQSREEPES